MTSVQIAEITNKKHNHLLRDIRVMENAWIGLGQSRFGLTSYT
ncbi:Rha family transcriptional regulator, partial [Tenacibaculum piscium]